MNLAPCAKGKLSMTKWTTEQYAFISACSRGEATSLCAVAGSGKTTTMVEGVKSLSAVAPFTAINCVAFNKAIAVELSKQMPPGVLCKTMNSTGHQAWSRHIDRLLKINPKKTIDNAKALWGEGFSFHKQRELSDVPKLVSLAKLNGLNPASVSNDELIELIMRFGLLIPREFELIAANMTRDLLVYSIREAHRGLIDFDDQLYMPTTFDGNWNPQDFILIDEAQDISAIQIKMLRAMLARDGQLIAIGDPNQAIYGFRGALSSAMKQIALEFTQNRMNLTYTFRCSSAVTAEAAKLVPHIKCSPEAATGSVEEVTKLNLHNLTLDDAVICRNTKPLIKLSLRLIRSKIPATIRGRNIGAGLNKLIESMNATNLGELNNKLENFRAEETSRLMQFGLESRVEYLNDRIDTILFVMKAHEDVRDTRTLTAALVSLFSDNAEGIELSTIHRFKGLERLRVFFLEPELIPSRFAKLPWQLEQENNLRYVATTRAIRDLIYVPASTAADGAA